MAALLFTETLGQMVSRDVLHYRGQFRSMLVQMMKYTLPVPFDSNKYARLDFIIIRVFEHLELPVKTFVQRDRDGRRSRRLWQPLSPTSLRT